MLYQAAWLWELTGYRAIGDKDFPITTFFLLSGQMPNWDKVGKDRIINQYLIFILN